MQVMAVPVSAGRHEFRGATFSPACCTCTQSFVGQAKDTEMKSTERRKLEVFEEVSV